MNASAAQLARTWGWNRVRAGRRLQASQTAGFHSEERESDHCDHDVTAGVTNAVTATPAVTVDRRVTAGVTEVVTGTVTRVALAWH